MSYFIAYLEEAVELASCGPAPSPDLKAEMQPVAVAWIDRAVLFGVVADRWDVSNSRPANSSIDFEG
jgi:hypothetical protein